MIKLGWLVRACDEVQGGDAWLSLHERDRLAGMKFAKRRDDFRVGRWTAKCAVRALTATIPERRDGDVRGSVGSVSELRDRDVRGGMTPIRELHEIDIRAAADGAPEVFFPGGPAPYSVSIAHSGGRALAVVGPAGVAFGADLETIEPRSAAFLEDYFLADEQRWIVSHPEDACAGHGGVRQASERGSTAGTTSSHPLFSREVGDGVLPEAASRAAAATLLWSVKESVLKALRAGLREDTRDVETLPGSALFVARTPPVWRPVGALVRGRGESFEGFAMEREGQVITILARGAVPDLVELAA